MALKITSIEATSVALPLTSPISSALGTYAHIPGVAVKVRTADGPDGFGFALGLGGSWSRAAAAYLSDELAPFAIGEDALAPEALWQRMWAPNKARLRAGIGAWALSAIDIAIWDIVAKAAGLPLHTILGGYRSQVPLYGSGGWHSLSDAELVAECEGFAALGISSYKYKIGSPRDIQRTALLRQAMGDDFMLLADANQNFDVLGAIEASKMLADYGVAWLEEPVLADSIDDLAQVAESSAVPIATGENAYFRWEFKEICERRGASYLQPDVARCGGVTEFRKIAALAEAYNLRLSSHLWHELSISLVGASPAGWAAEYTTLLPADLWTRRFEVVNGHMEVPDCAGHGVELSAEAVKRYAL